MSVNEPFLREVLATIELNQDRWNQRSWAGPGSCGTAYCLAGWAYVLHTGKEPDLRRLDEADLEGVAMSALGLSVEQADALFLFMHAWVRDADGQIIDERPLTFDDLCAKVEEVTGIRFKPSPPILE